MPQFAQPSSEVTSLRAEHYNASVVDVQPVNPSLMILSVCPDEGLLDFKPGRYTLLGLGNWEPRVAGSFARAEDFSPATAEDAGGNPRLVRRAYSISSSILTDTGTLVRAGENGIWEFYITLVQNPDHPSELTPRLFYLEAGDRLYMGPRCRGHYTLDRIRSPEDTIVFMATGCGEAPHNAMIAELLHTRHAGEIVSVVCTRRLGDLAYLAVHRRLQSKFANYTYLPMTTRDPRNLDRTHPDYVGKQYIQDYFASRQLEADAGLEFQPSKTHVFLCGNPAMIGLPARTRGQPPRYPKPTGMVELLEKRGFQIDRAGEPGNIHFEKYW